MNDPVYRDVSKDHYGPKPPGILVPLRPGDPLPPPGTRMAIRSMVGVDNYYACTVRAYTGSELCLTSSWSYLLREVANGRNDIFYVRPICCCWKRRNPS